jgi:tRNA pseudouridine32 synthase / 23S rRNA pseudouridine746 synthase
MACHRALMLEDRILFIDAEAIVIDKPAGLPVDTPRRGGDSVAGRLDELKLGFHRPPVLMHRLDQDTSGCLLLARNPKARKAFAEAFENGLVEKTYLAVVAAELGQGEGIIHMPLGKISSPESGWRMVPEPHGQPATTRWRRLAVRGGCTLVEFRPLTGRTHQLRVHAREGLGAAIVGDPVYGVGGGPPSTSSGQWMMLHASRLLVPRDKKPAIDVSAPLPRHFAEWADAA